jgi:FAD/FMN-containing dehydrogenase
MMVPGVNKLLWGNARNIKMVSKEARPSFGFSQMERTELFANVQGQVFLPDTPGYDQARLAWNRRVVQHPAVIVEAASAQDVAAAVDFARQHGLGVAVQGTGHGSIRPADNCLLILTRAMQGLQIDPLSQTARIEAGLEWGPVLAAAQEYKLAPLLGSSPGVGVVGYTLGGGLGWLGRKYGLSTDNVLQFEIVTADGRLQTASADENLDLFWGLRGGGGSLGIVTALTIRLFPVSQVYAGNLMYPLSMASEVFRRYREWIAGAPDELTSSVLIMNYPPLPQVPEFLRGQSFAVVRGCYCGMEEEGEALLRYWREWQPPQIDDFKLIPFSRADSISSDPVDPLPGYMTGAWLRSLNDEAVDAIVRYAPGQGGPSPLAFVEVRHAGGAIGRLNPDVSAYGNRDAELSMVMVGMAPTADTYQRLVDYTDRLKGELSSALSGGVYMNFLDGAEAQKRIHDALGPGGYERLARLKARVDPENLFRFSQNIVPAV